MFSRLQNNVTTFNDLVVDQLAQNDGCDNQGFYYETLAGANASTITADENKIENFKMILSVPPTTPAPNQTAWQNKKVPTTFGHIPLFFNQRGEIIYETSTPFDEHLLVIIASTDEQHIEKIVRKLFAHTLRAIDNHHARDFVYLNINMSSFVFLERSRSSHLRLRTQPYTVEVNTEGYYPKDSARVIYNQADEYTSPELSDCEKKSKNIYKINLKAADCYSMGMLGKKILSLLQKQGIQLPLMSDLCEKLTEKDPARRIKISEAMKHTFFGNDAHLCDIYFLELDAIVKKYNLHIDRKPVNLYRVKENCVYLIANADLKPIAKYCHRLLDRMKKFKEWAEQPSSPERTEELDVIVQSIDFQIKRLLKSIKKVKKNSEYEIYSAALEQIKHTAKEISSGVKGKKENITPPSTAVILQLLTASKPLAITAPPSENKEEENRVLQPSNKQPTATMLTPPPAKPSQVPKLPKIGSR